MSLGFIFIITPAVGWAWPALGPILTAAASALGYSLLNPDAANEYQRKSFLQRKVDELRWVTLPLDEFVTEVVAEEIGTEERLTFMRDDLRLVFRKDTAGKFFIEVVGPNKYSAMNLRIRGEEFAHEVVKKFAYHKMMEQIERRGATVVEEEVKTDGEVRLKARQFR